MTPRPNKPINRGTDGGSLDSPVSRPRQHTWTKYGEANLGTSSIEVTVDDLTILEGDEPPADQPGTPTSKYAQRSMPGHAKVVAAAEAGPGEPGAEQKVRRVRDWVSTRSIEGRIYRRTDAATWIEEIEATEATTSWVEL